ncbi:MAG: DUF2318 domain-containing protein [archaeon]
MKLWIPIILFAGIVILSGCVSNAAEAPNGSGNNSTAQNTISVPLNSVGTNAKWLEYESGGIKIRFFAVKASDGSIKTAFDACDVCYVKKKGYRQEGNFMVCNNCGKRFAIDSLGTENKNPGGCWPGYLPNKIVGDSVVIEKADLENGGWKFA